MVPYTAQIYNIIYIMVPYTAHRFADQLPASVNHRSVTHKTTDLQSLRE